MQFDKEKIGDVSIARIQERKLTSQEAPAMKTAILGWIVGGGDKFLINLKDVQNMDSTGLGAFLFGIRQADQHEKDLRFCEVQPKIQFLIRIAHLEQVIDVYDTEEQALEDFKKDYQDE